MEQTLGKRIAEHRKRLGMTQDALAEKLGITAQAVSKWENDLSCPDINMLPKLSEIFGITTDELLGRKPSREVYEAEVVNEKESQSGGVHIQNGNWEFHWDSGRKHGLIFAAFVLWTGVFAFLSRWLDWGASFWDIMWPSLLLIYGIAGIFPGFSVFRLFVALFGGYSLVANLGLWQLNITKELIFPICVVALGLVLLLDTLRKPKKPRFRITKKGGNGEKTKNACSNSQHTFDCDVSCGDVEHLVTAKLLHGGRASVHFGELTIDLSMVEAVAEDCLIEANGSFAEICLKVPKKFHVICKPNTAFGDLNTVGYPDANPEGTIRLTANANFGEISIHYI